MAMLSAHSKIQEGSLPRFGNLFSKLKELVVGQGHGHIPTFSREFASENETWHPVAEYHKMREASIVPPRSYGFLAATPTLRANYERHGEELGAYNVEDYLFMARRFLEVAMEPGNIGYTFLKMGRNAFGVDYQGELRGIYQKNGMPMAFFKPDHTLLGYPNKEAELEAWKKKGHVLPTLKLS